MYAGDARNQRNTCSCDVSCEVDAFNLTGRQTEKHVNGKSITYT